MVAAALEMARAIGVSLFQNDPRGLAEHAVQEDCGEPVGALLKFDEPSHTGAGHVAGHGLLRPAGRSSARPRAVGEDVHVQIARFASNVLRAGEVGLGLSREAADDVGSDGRRHAGGRGEPFAGHGEHVAVVAYAVLPVHSLEDGVAATL